MELDQWILPQKKGNPVALVYRPELTDESETILNPFLGYANCPLLGRYNKGQYRIGETLMHISFKCKFDNNINCYKCGNKTIGIPDVMLYNLRNIPEDIPNNKPLNLKNVPDFLPEKYPVLPNVTFTWIVSFGELGKDFLNYLNHMYTLACTLFLEEKLKRSVYYLPIYGYLPDSSGVAPEEVDRGISYTNYRGEYMSFHLKNGAPAFSPNNIRIAIEGMKKVYTQKNVPNKKNAKKQTKIKYVEKKEKQLKEKPIEKEIHVNFEELENQISQEENMTVKSVEKIEEKSKQQIKQVQNKNVNRKQGEHQGFIHFYSSVLLENDYRVYYHWHIEDMFLEEVIKESLKNSYSLENLLQKFGETAGKNILWQQMSRILSKHH